MTCFIPQHVRLAHGCDVDTFCWLLYSLAFILMIYCCKDTVKKSDTVLTLSPDVKFVIKNLKLYSRKRRGKQGGDQQKFAPIQLNEEWMEPLALIRFQSPETT